MTFKKRIFFTLLALVMLSLQGFSQEKGDKIFDGTILHEIKFYSDTEPNLYELLQSEVNTFFRPYHLVKMVFDGEEVDSIGIRVKGFSSAQFSDQVPFKIDINEYVSEQTFDGEKKLNLGNSFADLYRQKDRVAYELFKRAGVAAPRSAYAEVYINDIFINMYLLVEQIDKTFIKENFADLGSSLTKKGPTGSKVIYGDNFNSNPILLVGSEDRLSKVNLESYFKFIIINHIIVAGDNYPDNNFYFYHSEKEDKVYFIPWDYNLSLGGALEESDLELVPDGAAIFANSEYKELFLDIACELSHYLLDEAYLDSLMDANYDIIQSNSQGATVDNPAPLKDFLQNVQSILANEQLPVAGAMCGSFSYPYEIGDLVINEFVAKSDSIGGVQEPDGGTPDWIELYNNTNQDIVLNRHFYLSDDVNFLKKWNFDTPVTIPANGYQIVWADRDVHQAGVHSNFKIEKSGGDLILTYEDLTVIDQVAYDEQELNMGYARIPNGTGDFVIQNHTFNSNNAETSSTSSINELANIAVYPNPTTGEFTLQVSEITAQTVNISLYSSDGRLLKTDNFQSADAYIGDLNAFGSGIYFVELTSGDFHLTRKVVKY